MAAGAEPVAAIWDDGIRSKSTLEIARKLYRCRRFGNIAIFECLRHSHREIEVV
jgi:hypothetical protein